MFGRQFFEQDLDQLAQAFGRENGIENPTVQLVLENGFVFKVQGKPVLHDGWMVVRVAPPRGEAKKQPRQAVVPYAAVVAVSFAEDDSPSGRIGFRTE